MSDSAIQILPAETPFVTVKDAMEKVKAVLAKAPIGGTLLGITRTSVSQFIISTPEEEGLTAWRMGVIMTIPRRATMLCAWMASWGLPYSTRKISFVIDAHADQVTVGSSEGGPQHRAHNYVLLNGTFQLRHHFSTEMEQSRPFRDDKTRLWYDTTFDTTDFEQILEVILSELTGKKPSFWS